MPLQRLNQLPDHQLKPLRVQHHQEMVSVNYTFREVSPIQLSREETTSDAIDRCPRKIQCHVQAVLPYCNLFVVPHHLLGMLKIRTVVCLALNSLRSVVNIRKMSMPGLSLSRIVFELHKPQSI